MSTYSFGYVLCICVSGDTDIKYFSYTSPILFPATWSSTLSILIVILHFFFFNRDISPGSFHPSVSTWTGLSLEPVCHLSTFLHHPSRNSTCLFPCWNPCFLNQIFLFLGSFPSFGNTHAPEASWKKRYKESKVFEIRLLENIFFFFFLPSYFYSLSRELGWKFFLAEFWRHCCISF